MAGRYHPEREYYGTMNKRFSILLPFTLLLFSCEESSYLTEDYPTIIEKINPDRLNTMRIEFARQNVYVETSLGDYGFCGFSDALIPSVIPSVDTTVSKSEAIEIAKEFISQNSRYTGVKDIDDINFSKVEEMRRSWDGNKCWHLVTINQRIDTVELLSSSILINIRGEEVTYCLGNWFPDIYIPKRFNITSEKATKLLLNRKVTHYTWGGSIEMVITSESLHGSTARLVIITIEREDRIEIHVAWKIYIPRVSFILYVDVMTGEVIGEEPTIIS
jgi:hypothetical protein